MASNNDNAISNEEDIMDKNDRQAIENLFEKLATVERQSPQRDAELETFIRDKIARQPGAPYYMAQTIVVQGAGARCCRSAPGGARRATR